MQKTFFCETACQMLWSVLNVNAVLTFHPLACQAVSFMKPTSLCDGLKAAVQSSTGAFGKILLFFFPHSVTFVCKMPLICSDIYCSGSCGDLSKAQRWPHLNITIATKCPEAFSEGPGGGEVAFALWHHQWQQKWTPLSLTSLIGGDGCNYYTWKQPFQKCSQCN